MMVDLFYEKFNEITFSKVKIISNIYIFSNGINFKTSLRKTSKYPNIVIALHNLIKKKPSKLALI